MKTVVRVAGAIAACFFITASSAASFLKGRVTFDLPQGFSQLSESWVRLKFPKLQADEYVIYGDPRRVATAAVAIRKLDLPITTDELLEQFSGFSKEALSKAMGVNILSKSEATMGGTRWLRIEMIIRAVDGEIYTDLYQAGLDGKLLNVSFSTTLKTRDKFFPAFYAIRRSFRVK